MQVWFLMLFLCRVHYRPLFKQLWIYHSHIFLKVIYLCTLFLDGVLSTWSKYLDVLRVLFIMVITNDIFCWIVFSFMTRIRIIIFTDLLCKYLFFTEIMLILSFSMKIYNKILLCITQHMISWSFFCVIVWYQQPCNHYIYSWTMWKWRGVPL